MKKMNCAILAVLFSLIVFSAAFGEEALRHSGPPPEAFKACEGKKAGDTSQFVDPRGETVAGSCERQGDRLVLRPDRDRRQGNGRRHGPPPEAYEACQGKKAGERSRFVNPEGVTTTGTCEIADSRLVLRPDHPKQGRGGGQNSPSPAYTACEGKKAGEKSRFVNSKGETMTGTCQREGDRLVLRPDQKG